MIDMRNDGDTIGVLVDFDVFWFIFRPNGARLLVAWSWSSVGSSSSVVLVP